MAWFLKSSCLVCHPILIGRALLEVREDSGERDSSGEELEGINMTVTDVGRVLRLALCHHYTLNTGVRSTRLSWLWLVCKWSGSWGKTKNWKIYLKALRKGQRQFAKIWEGLIFQGAWDQERGPNLSSFQWSGNLYRKVNITGLGMLSSESLLARLALIWHLGAKISGMFSPFPNW